MRKSTYEIGKMMYYDEVSEVDTGKKEVEEYRRPQPLIEKDLTQVAYEKEGVETPYVFKRPAAISNYKEKAGSALPLSPFKPLTPERVIIIEELEKILAQPGLLTFDQLRFIATQVLPSSSRLSPTYLEKLVERLRKDVYERREFYRINYHINWSETLLDPLQFIKEQELKSLPPDKRLKRCLRAEACVEFASRDVMLFKNFLDGKISYDEYEKESRSLAQKTYGGLKIV